MARWVPVHSIRDAVARGADEGAEDGSDEVGDRAVPVGALTEQVR